MKWVAGFLSVIYDLVIGNCWQIAAAVAVLLSVGAGVLKMQVLPESVFAVTLGVAIMAGAALIIYYEALAAHRQHDTRRSIAKDI